MCGIIGYTGFRKASDVILRGLKTLEYRGYDSAGIAVSGPKGLEIRKGAGKVAEVSESLLFSSLEGNAGIGHTRWATHGKVCNENAHPHANCSKSIALVHNGVIENYLSIKEALSAEGHKFESETDSEVVAHLIEENMKNMPIERAFQESIKALKGSYAIVMAARGENRIFAARKNSPLIAGIGKGEFILASDITAALPYTKKIVPVDEERIVIASEKEIAFYDYSGKEANPNYMEVDWTAETAEKGGFPHFMLKEIYEQKLALPESLAADVKDANALIEKAKNIHIIACGTSYHAGLVLSILLEKQTGKFAKAFIASEYPFIANPEKGTLALAISQSGETADTMQAARFAKAAGAKLLALTNVVGSSLSRLADSTVYLNAGPEVSVAATKTFSSQLALAYRLAYGSEPWAKEIPRAVEKALAQEQSVKSLSSRFKDANDVFFIGRGLSYPIAMEGALKLKELSYIHAEAYPGGELKHGPLSLIQPGTLVVALAPSDESLPKMHGNIKEVKARGAFVIALTDNPEITKEVDFALHVEKSRPELYPFAMLPLLQMLAYYASTSRGIDPDRPRNLAKSVTVE